MEVKFLDSGISNGIPSRLYRFQLEHGTRRLQPRLLDVLLTYLHYWLRTRLLNLDTMCQRAGTGLHLFKPNDKTSVLRHLA